MKLYLKEKNPKEDSEPQILEINVYYDEVLKDILRKFNDFRGPDNQVISLYNEYGQEIPVTFKVKSDLTFYYECGSITEEK